MSIVGKVYKIRLDWRNYFPVWETKLLVAHATKNRIRRLDDAETKIIYLGSVLVGSHETPITKLLIDGVIWYTYLNPIIDSEYFEEL